MVFVPFAVLAVTNLLFWGRLMYLLRFTDTFDSSIGVPWVAMLAPLALSLLMGSAAGMAAAIDKEQARAATRLR